MVNLESEQLYCVYLVGLLVTIRNKILLSVFCQVLVLYTIKYLITIIETLFL